MYSPFSAWPWWSAASLLILRGRPGLILVFIGVPLLVMVRDPRFRQGLGVTFQFFIFGVVLIIMMLFRREGLIPEARIRLVLREPGRTEMESLGADMEDVAPELESLHGRHAARRRHGAAS